MIDDRPNPFAPPVADNFGAAEASPVASHYVLATRGERLLAAILDTVLMIVPLMLWYFPYVLLYEQAEGGELLVFAMMLLFLAHFVVQWVLIAKRGQTLGKIALKIRIEHLDGTPVTFWSGVVLRNWLLAVANAVVGVISLIDVLFIFGHEQRCLHDLIANTRVVAVDPEIAN